MLKRTIFNFQFESNLKHCVKKRFFIQQEIADLVTFTEEILNGEIFYAVNGADDIIIVRLYVLEKHFNFIKF